MPVPNSLLTCTDRFPKSVTAKFGSALPAPQLEKHTHQTAVVQGCPISQDLPARVGEETIAPREDSGEGDP